MAGASRAGIPVRQVGRFGGNFVSLGGVSAPPAELSDLYTAPLPKPWPEYASCRLNGLSVAIVPFALRLSQFAGTPYRREILQSRHDLWTRQKSDIPVVGVCLDQQSVFPSIQRCLAKTGYMSKFRPCHPVVISNSPNLVGRQHTKMVADCNVFQSFRFLIQIFEFACTASTYGHSLLQADQGPLSSIVKCMNFPCSRDAFFAAHGARRSRLFGLHPSPRVTLLLSVQVFRIHLLTPSTRQFGIVKATPDDFPRSQLKLDVELSLAWFEVDFHHVSDGSLWRMQLHGLDRMPFFQPCRDELPRRSIRKAGVEHSVWIPNLSQTSTRRAFYAECCHAGTDN